MILGMHNEGNSPYALSDRLKSRLTTDFLEVRLSVFDNFSKLINIGSDIKLRITERVAL